MSTLETNEIGAASGNVISIRSGDQLDLSDPASALLPASAMDYLGEVVAVNSAYLLIDDSIFPAMFDGTYQSLHIDVQEWYPTNDVQPMYAQVEANNSYQTGGTDYQFEINGSQAGGALVNGNGGADKMRFSFVPAESNAGVSHMGHMWLSDPSNTTSWFRIMAELTSRNNDGNFEFVHAAQMAAFSNPVTGIRWFAGFGNINGKFKVWGLRA